MKDKRAIVTGASSGIGKITARALAQKGARVTIVVRDRARGEAALAEIDAVSTGGKADLVLADFASLASIRAATAEILAKDEPIHVLVNNAGAVMDARHLTVDGFESTFGVNHLGYFAFTTALLERIQKSAPARIVNVASDAHKSAKIDWDDLQCEKSFSTFTAYGNSKLMNILFTVELARRLKDEGVTVNCCHPGVVATNFGKSGAWWMRFGLTLVRPFFLTEEEGAATQIYLATSPEVADVTGKYFAKSKEAKARKDALDPDLAKRLWEVSEKLVAAKAKAA